MKTGTKSLLFGVHQFLWHPITVALAWRRYHGRWPQDKAEWVAIICHDLGYWGCAEMDGPEGKEHPLLGARIAWRILQNDRVARQKAMTLCLWHSSGYASRCGQPVLSDLYAPDKLSVLVEPRWFYLLRALASGEVWEYISHGPKNIAKPRPFLNPWQWLNWYREKTQKKFYGS